MIWYAKRHLPWYAEQQEFGSTYLLVRDLVPALIRGDGAADLGKCIVSMLQRMASSIAVGDLQRAATRRDQES